MLIALSMASNVSGYSESDRALNRLLGRLRECDFVAIATVIEKRGILEFEIETLIQGEPYRLYRFKGLMDLLHPSDRLLLFSSSSSSSEYSVSWVVLEDGKARWSEDGGRGETVLREDREQRVVRAIRASLPRMAK